MNSQLIVVVYVYLSCVIVRGDVYVSCKDEANKRVEWSIGYKIPRNPESTDATIKIGAAYFFMTSDSQEWQRSSKLINNPDSIVGISTKPLYDLTTNLAYVLYNDQPPEGKAVIYNGHTKGILMASNSTAIWIVHSVPHFPKLGQAFKYPDGGLENGQIFLCLTLNITDLDKVGTALQYTKPHIYNASLPGCFPKLLSNLNKVVDKNATQSSPPWFTSFKLEAGGLDFSVFVKGPKFRKDIYADWIAPELETGLDVQSWLNGAHPLQSNCRLKYPVLNILSKNIVGQKFSTLNDHAKWAIGIDKQSVCITDLNRMKPQKTRGGVAVCVTNNKIWSTFKNVVSVVQPCNVTIPQFDKYLNRRTNK